MPKAFDIFEMKDLLEKAAARQHVLMYDPSNRVLPWACVRTNGKPNVVNHYGDPKGGFSVEKGWIHIPEPIQWHPTPEAAIQAAL